jgi:hypothetical protein
MASQPPPKTDAIALLKQDHANVKELGPAPFPLERERPIAEGAYLRWLARGGAHEFNAPEEIDF